jgi:arabinogalactan endo-1,4-beta-galactosidase
MEDCGAVFREGGKVVDPFVVMKAHGGNIMRVRIWNAPGWTKYSTYEDVLKTIRRMRRGWRSCWTSTIPTIGPMAKQIAPAAWAKLSTDDQVSAA